MFSKSESTKNAEKLASLIDDLKSKIAILHADDFCKKCKISDALQIHYAAYFFNRASKEYNFKSMHNQKDPYVTITKDIDLIFEKCWAELGKELTVKAVLEKLINSCTDFSRLVLEKAVIDSFRCEKKIVVSAPTFQLKNLLGCAALGVSALAIGIIAVVLLNSMALGITLAVTLGVALIAYGFYRKMAQEPNFSEVPELPQLVV